MKFKTATEMTEEEFIKAHTTGAPSLGDSPEIINYLRLRHQYFNKKKIDGLLVVPTYAIVAEAFNKTNLRRIVL